MDVDLLRKAAESSLASMRHDAALPAHQIGFTPAAKAINMERAAEAARSLGHVYVGTEHILLGMYDDVTVGKALAAARATREHIQSEIATLMSPPQPNPG